MRKTKNTDILTGRFLQLMVVALVAITIYLAAVYVLPHYEDSKYVEQVTEIGELKKLTLENLCNDGKYKSIRVYRDNNEYYVEYYNGKDSRSGALDKDTVNSISESICGYLNTLENEKNIYSLNDNRSDKRQFKVNIEYKQGKGYSIKEYESFTLKPSNYDKVFETIETKLEEILK